MRGVRPLWSAMTRSILSAILALSMALPLVAQTPSAVRVGTVTAPLPPGARVPARPGARGDFGGTFVQLDDRLTVELAALPPSHLSLWAYVDSIVVARNRAADPDWQLDPPIRRDVAGRAAWVLHPPCGDCDATEVYLDFPGTRLVASWGVDGLGAHTAEDRNAAAWALVAALHP